MKFGFVAKHRGTWPVRWLCEALGVSRSGFHGWLTRPRSARARSDEELTTKVRASFVASSRTYGARRIWHDVLADGGTCGLHRIERLMRAQALRARPRRRGLPADTGVRAADAVAANVLDRQFKADAPNQKWVADFTYIWTAEGWLYVAAVLDLFSRRVVGWSMSATMTAQLVTDALLMAIWRRANHGLAQGDLLEHQFRASTERCVKFWRIEIGNANFNPTVRIGSGADAETVAISDITDTAAKNLSNSIRQWCLARISEGRGGCEYQERRK